jgi:predicted TIM-barrel fold metal-dependent hydrolase
MIFPAECLWTDFGALVAAWRDVLDRYPEDVQRAVLGQTERRLYRL